MSRSIARLCVVVPAHDESAVIAGCLDALAVAAHRLDQRIDILAVLDCCTDATAAVCAAAGVPTISTDARNVGAARAAGFGHLLRDRGTRLSRTWLATTDADSRVHPRWLAEQVRLADLGADAVFGVVDVDDWSPHAEQAARVRRRFEEIYRGTETQDAAPHSHVHGASMGVRASSYLRAGGFAPLAVGEDQELSDRLDRLGGTTVVRTTAVRAVTSARTATRAAGGFGDLLRSLGT